MLSASKQAVSAHAAPTKAASQQAVPQGLSQRVLSPKEPNWQAVSFKHQNLSKTLRAWLLDPGSLTQKLIDRSKGQLRVEVLQQRIQRPHLSEYQALKLNTHRWAVVREVVLYGNDIPWVCARTVIPLSTLKGSLRRLHYLGNRSLGEALFADPTMRRQGLQLAVIKPHHLPKSSHQFTSGWGRRSLFFLKNKPLLVCEIFLKNLTESTDE